MVSLQKKLRHRSFAVQMRPGLELVNAKMRLGSKAMWTAVADRDDVLAVN
jgi:hypothetical protein